VSPAEQFAVSTLGWIAVVCGILFIAGVAALLAVLIRELIEVFK